MYVQGYYIKHFKCLFYETLNNIKHNVHEYIIGIYILYRQLMTLTCIILKN